MKHSIITVLACAAALLLSSCREDRIECYGSENYIHFKQKSDSPYRFSFATMPGADTYVLDIPVILIGNALEEDKPFAVEVVKDGDVKTTAPESTFSVPQAPLFKKGVFEDVLSVTFTNSAELSTEKVLVLRVAQNENFKKGPVDYQLVEIHYSNILAQPSWWDKSMSEAYLGPYSDIKYTAFIEATGVSELDPKEQAKLTAYVMQFVNYLRKMDAEGKTVYENDGVTKVLDSVSYAKQM
jgi:hypothetical protein